MNQPETHAICVSGNISPPLRADTWKCTVFLGVVNEKDILPSVQGIDDDKQKNFDPAEFSDWIAVITHWRERLHAVAKEVKQGQAGVMFANARVLQYCEVLPLLRLPERQRLLAKAAAGTGIY